MRTPEKIDNVGLDFIAVRHKLLDVAAFLDRVERTGESSDFRVQSLQKALPLLSCGGMERAKAILEHFSDQSAEPVGMAPGKGATGAVPLELDV